MENAYKISADIVNQDLAAKEGIGLKAWQATNRINIIVVPGEYDTTEKVLDSLDLQYESKNPEDFDDLQLDTRDVVIVNCPGDGFSEKGLDILKNHVFNGGLLVTTDWALKHVVQRAFPGFIEHNGAETAEEFVDVRVTDKIMDYLNGLIAPGLNPSWWLEEGSYPIRILNTNVRKLLVSRAMKERYDAPTIACIIHFGKGLVLHMTSHLFLKNAAPLDLGDNSALQRLLENLHVNQLMKERVKMACENDTSYKAIEAAYILESLVVRILRNHVKPK
ncbi:MAG: hypothetical protein Q6373_000245 [Candidatus Sigynarchaeota archaeon]